MAAVPGNALTLAVGKQTALGTAQTAPSYKLRYTGGFGPDPVRNTITLAETDATRQQGDPVVVGLRVEGSSEHYVRPDEFGLLALLLFGQVTTTGAGPNYTHTYSSTATGSAPYATLYKAQNTTAFVDRYVDCQVGSLTIRGGAEQALSVSCDWTGLSYTTGETDPAGSPVATSPMVYPEVTITKAGVASGVIDSFELTVTQNRSLVVGDTGLSAGAIVPGMFAVTGSLSILFESDAERRLFHTGSTGGTTPTSTVGSEALNIAVVRNANLSITFDLDNVIPTNVTVPANTDGSPIRMGYEFSAKRDATLANVVECVVKNQIASY
jgi:hypothetical protein